MNQMEDDEKSIKIWDCGSPLYDSYELVSWSHLIERNLMVLPYLSGSRTDDDDESNPISSSEKSKRDDSPSNNAGKPGFYTVLKRKIVGERKEKAKKRKTGISKFFSWKK
ncbi:hypothetical protein ACS0TY_019628 [Phlomoides rotata]